jgi:hypothetical protein
MYDLYRRLIAGFVVPYWITYVRERKQMLPMWNMLWNTPFCMDGKDPGYPTTDKTNLVWGKDRERIIRVRKRYCCVLPYVYHSNIK